MSLPTAVQLQDRQVQARDKIERLKNAHDNFLSAWKEIEDQRNDILMELQSFVDKAKIHGILEKLDNLKLDN